MKLSGLIDTQIIEPNFQNCYFDCGDMKQSSDAAVRWSDCVLTDTICKWVYFQAAVLCPQQCDPERCAQAVILGVASLASCVCSQWGQGLVPGRDLKQELCRLNPTVVSFPCERPLCLTRSSTTRSTRSWRAWSAWWSGCGSRRPSRRRWRRSGSRSARTRTWRWTWRSCSLCMRPSDSGARR